MNEQTLSRRAVFAGATGLGIMVLDQSPLNAARPRVSSAPGASPGVSSTQPARTCGCKVDPPMSRRSISA